LEIQREVAKNLTFEARYIGSKGTKLYGGTSLNDVNIFASAAGQTLLDAFNQTRAGQDAPLFDLLLRGLQLNPGQTVGANGVTGSAALRQNTLTRNFLALGQVGSFASFLNTTTSATTSGAGGILRNGGLPDNWL